LFMNARFVKSVIGVGLLALASVASMAAQSSELKVSVPFAFVVAGHKLPAGDYFVQKADQTGMVMIHARTGESAIVLAVATGDYNAVDGQPGLSFERNGQGEAVLTKIQMTDQPRLTVNSHASLNGGKTAASR
jgi:hypothetical protein